MIKYITTINWDYILHLLTILVFAPLVAVFLFAFIAGASEMVWAVTAGYAIVMTILTFVAEYFDNH